MPERDLDHYFQKDYPLTLTLKNKPSPNPNYLCFKPKAEHRFVRISFRAIMIPSFPPGISLFENCTNLHSTGSVSYLYPETLMYFQETKVDLACPPQDWPFSCFSFIYTILAQKAGLCALQKIIWTSSTEKWDWASADHAQTVMNICKYLECLHSWSYQQVVDWPVAVGALGRRTGGEGIFWMTRGTVPHNFYMQSSFRGDRNKQVLQSENRTKNCGLLPFRWKGTCGAKLRVKCKKCYQRAEKEKHSLNIQITLFSSRSVQEKFLWTSASE